MNTSPTPEAEQAARRAVARIRSYGIDGPRPIEEIEALLEHEDQVDAALRVVLEDAAADELAAALHLVVLLRRGAVIDVVTKVAFERPASVDAKREAIEALRACDVEPDAQVLARFAVLESIGEADAAGTLGEILDWPQAWRQPGLRAWLAAAGAERLADVEQVLGRDHELDAELLDWIAALASPDAGDVLQRYLAAASDRRRVKQAKRALHVMRSKGFAVADPADGPGQGGGFSLRLDSSSLDGSRAYATSIDGDGARLVWVLWRSAGGGSRLLQAVIDDKTGLREAETANVTRKGFRDYVEKMASNPALLLGQIDVGDALQLLASAAERKESAGDELAAAYRQWREQLDVPIVAAGGGAPRIYEFVDAESVRGDAELIDAAMNLLREPHFQSWAMAGAIVDAAADEIHAAETSTLMVSDEQRRERMQDAIRDAVRDAFDDDARRLYRTRLEEMAAMLWSRGEQVAARQAVAAAVGLTEVEDLFRDHAFARALVHRGVWLAYQDRQRERLAQEQRSGIIKP